MLQLTTANSGSDHLAPVKALGSSVVCYIIVILYSRNLPHIFAQKPGKD